MVVTRFTRACHELCVERSCVRGLLDAPRISAAPGAPAWLLGACNHFGRAVAVLDLPGLAGLAGLVGLATPRGAPGAPRRVVLVACPAGLVGFAADESAVDLTLLAPPRTDELLVPLAENRWLVDLSRLPLTVAAALAGA